MDFFCNGLTEDQNYYYWYNNIYVLEYFNSYVIDAFIGLPVYINPFSHGDLWEKYVQSMTVEELNERITYTFTPGKGMKVINMTQGFVEHDEDGDTWIEMPAVEMEAADKAADGATFTITVKDSAAGTTENFVFTVELGDYVRKEPKIVSQPAGKLMKGNYGTYQLEISEKTDVPIMPVYTTLDGQKADVECRRRQLQCAGTFEYPAVRKYADHLEFDVTGLSPIAIAWTEPAEVPVTPPSTGDSATPVLWVIGMLAAAGCAMIITKRRQIG